MKRSLLVALLVLVGCSSGSGDTPTPSAPSAAPSPAALVTVAGTFEVDGGRSAFEGCNDSPAQLHGGYSDIGEGTTVTVYDDGGKITGTTNLTDAAGAVDNDGTNGYCRFSFTVDVPDSPFYQVEVSHRGRVTVQRADAGDVKLTLGG